MVFSRITRKQSNDKSSAMSHSSSNKIISLQKQKSKEKSTEIYNYNVFKIDNKENQLSIFDIISIFDINNNQLLMFDNNKSVTEKQNNIWKNFIKSLIINKKSVN